jgi:hypothetical protein
MVEGVRKKTTSIGKMLQTKIGLGKESPGTVGHSVQLYFPFLGYFDGLTRNESAVKVGN